MPYVDGFVIPVRTERLDDYRKMSETFGAVVREYGALSYMEAVAEDVPYGELTSFPRSVQATDDETVVFGWIVYDSREDRDAIMAKAMADERVNMDPETSPFDGRRMIFGGFDTLVTL